MRVNQRALRRRERGQQTRAARGRFGGAHKGPLAAAEAVAEWRRSRGVRRLASCWSACRRDKSNQFKLRPTSPSARPLPSAIVAAFYSLLILSSAHCGCGSARRRRGQRATLFCRRCFRLCQLPLPPPPPPPLGSGLGELGAVAQVGRRRSIVFACDALASPARGQRL